jgi:hypothetical protein
VSWKISHLPVPLQLSYLTFAIIELRTAAAPDIGHPNAIATPRHEPLFGIPRTVVRISQSDDCRDLLTQYFVNADALDTTLSQDYRVAVEKRVYLSQGEETILIGIPGVSVTATPPANTTTTTAIATEPTIVEIPLAEEVQERYLEIREISTSRVVTVIELLSPKNKRSGEGRDAYSQKRQRIMLSQTHLVEIDLLRYGSTRPTGSGDPLPMVGAVTSDYRILVSRSDYRPKAQLYAFNLRQPIPAIQIPLTADTAVALDLQPLLHQIYDRARFALAIDYQKSPIPKLPPEDLAWLNTTIDQGINI